jgi:VCBS repeat-containing protein
LVPNSNIVFSGSGSNRTATITPLANQSGTATITVTVSDGLATSSDTFLLTVTSINDVPTITGIADQMINEDTTTGALPFTISDVETAAATLSVTGTSSNVALVPNTNIVFGGSGINRTVTVTPLANQFGTTTITLTVSDGTATVTDTFLLTVDPVNDAPVITDQQILSTPEETALAIVFASLTVSDPDNPYSTGFTLLVQDGANYTRTGNTITPALNFNGTLTVPVLVNDGTDNSNTFNLAVTVTAVNDLPSIGDITHQTINEDTNTGALSFNIGDVETAATALSVTGSSSNTALVPNANIVFGGSGANRTATITPLANQFGTATITVTVNDGTATVADTFLLTVDPVNDAPTISDITNQAINEDANTGARAFTIGDVETAAASLSITGTSSNAALVSDANIVFGGSGPNRTVTVTPLANQFGATTITITVSDGVATSSDAFLLTVNSVNDVPTISNVTDQTINEDANTGALSFIVGDVETTAASLNVTGSSSNTTLVPNGNIVLSGSGANRSVTVTPAANRFGTATITVTVSDGTASSNDTFLLTVTGVNDVPTIGNIADRTINEDANTGAIPFTIGDVETAVASLTVTRSSSDTVLVPTANIVLGGSGASRSVTVTPAANQFGTATITVTVSDGTASISDTFLLTVNPVNDAPTVSNIIDQSIAVNTLTNGLPFTIGDAETAAASLTLNGTSSNPTLVTDANIFFGGSGASRTITVIPETNQIGSTTITVTVSDGALNGTDTFVVNVVAPEIAVEQPFNTNIPDGGSKTFGNVTVDSNTSLNFFIKNTGTADLTGLTITKDGTDASMFTITANPTAPVSGPNGNTAFTVRFTPASVGPKTVAIHIASNDLDEDPFDITVTGTGVIPITSWRQTYFGSPDNSGDGGNLDDYDHDGLVNLIEYAFGLNPTQNSAGQLPQGQIVGANFVLSFTEPAGVTGITYGAEWSATMASNDWLPITDSGIAPQHTFSVSISGNTNLFVRLTVSSP